MIASKERANRTAEGVAVWRAIGAMESDPRVRNPDFMAAGFLSPFYRALIGLSGVRTLFTHLYDRKFPGAYGYATARTLHLDATLMRALREGATQVVVLGAGYDSRAYRFREHLAGVRFFEVDLPATQTRKKARLAALLGAVPDWVTYVSIDFSTQRLDDVLPAAGYDPARRTFFLWEGVTMYLTPEAVDQTLGFVTQNAVLDSSIVFDYLARAALDGDSRYQGARRWLDTMIQLGYPLTFGIDEHAIDRFLSERGLEKVSHIGGDAMEQTYLIKSNGRLLWRTYGFLWIVHARVKAQASA